MSNPDKISELVERLRDADANSQQRALGSGIFGEAADTITSLQKALELATSRGCDHCAEPIRAARQALSKRATP